MAPVRLYVAARTFQSPASIAETPAAAVVVSHHGIEPIHIRIAVAIDGGLCGIHADVFGQAVPNLRCRKRGIGRIEGPIVGALIFWALNKFFSDYGSWYLLGLGLLAIVATIRFKQGLWGWAQARWGWSLFPTRRHLELGEGH